MTRRQWSRTLLLVSGMTLYFLGRRALMGV